MTGGEWRWCTDLISHRRAMVCPFLTHLPLDKMAAIPQPIFSDAFSWMKSFMFWLKFHWSLLRVQLTATQHWFGLDNGLALNRGQAIIWTNADPIYWRIYAALRGDELTVELNVITWFISTSHRWLSAWLQYPFGNALETRFISTSYWWLNAWMQYLHC